MKLFAVVIIILAIVVIALAGTSGPEKCPLCGKPMKEGDDIAHRIVRGQPRIIHYEDAFNKAWEMKTNNLRQIK